MDRKKTYIYNGFTNQTRKHTMKSLTNAVRQTTNDETSPFRFYLPQLLGVNANTAYLISAVIHAEREGMKFDYTNEAIAFFISCSPALVTKMIKASVKKGLITVSGKCSSRTLEVTTKLQNKIGA